MPAMSRPQRRSSRSWRSGKAACSKCEGQLAWERLIRAMRGGVFADLQLDLDLRRRQERVVNQAGMPRAHQAFGLLFGKRNWAHNMNAEVAQPGRLLQLSGGGHIFFSRDSKPARAPISESERPLAHQLYLQGRFEWNKRTPENLNQALDDFTQALIHDPEDAQTYAGLADTYDLLREYSTMPENEAYNRALTASRKTVELDGSLAEAHRSLGFAEVWGE
jgi:hypothetical protein